MQFRITLSDRDGIVETRIAENDVYTIVQAVDLICAQHSLRDGATIKVERFVN